MVSTELAMYEFVLRIWAYLELVDPSKSNSSQHPITLSKGHSVTNNNWKEDPLAQTAIIRQKR